VSRRELDTAVGERLAAADLRLTTPRRRVIAVLADADRPLTLPEILRRDSELAQSSTYRNLGELITAGVVHRIVAGEDHSHYELAEDLTHHHHHLVCTTCGGVTDVEADEAVELALESALRRAARRTGFRPEGHRLDVVGVCADCTA
jgi:Fur family transcriptional regulator, ferric uptake regulator